MSEWWHDLWNDPMNSNPWALGAAVVIVGATLWLLTAINRIGRAVRRRRERGKAMNVASPDPIRPDEVRTYAGQHAEDEPVVDDHGDDETVTQTRFVSSDDGQVYTIPASSAPTDEVRAVWGPITDPIPVPLPPHTAPIAGSASVPRSIVQPFREDCPHCHGTGYMPSISDHLRESIALVGDQGDDVIRSFYTMLLRQAPDLVKLFPGNPAEGDLGTDHKGAKQRERLLGAVVALSELYDPADADKMDRLDTALKAFGRSHAAFARPDGTVKGATWEEYAAVKDALFGTLIRVAGNAWKAEYTESWSQAYDYAAAVMLAEQYRSGFAAPRFPRA